MSSPKDTISSANSYYNNQYRIDPGFVRGCRALQKREVKDTLETKQQRLERHLETKFNLNQQVPSGKVVLFAQVGKYAILAFVMPPFYLFYEGPRWILVTVQPLFLIAFEKAGAVLLIISTFGVNFWARIGKKLRFFKKTKDVIKNKVSSLSQFFLNKIGVLGQKLYHGFQPVNQAIKKLKERLANLKEKRASFVHFFKTLPHVLRKKIETRKDAFKQALKEKIAVLMNSLKQVQIPFIALEKALNPVISFAKRQLENVINPILRISSTALTASKHTVEKVLNQARAFKEMLMVLLRPVLKAIEVSLKNSIKHVEKILSRLKKVSADQLKVLVNFLKAGVTAMVPMQNGIIQIGEFTKTAGLNLLQKGGLVFDRLKKMQPVIKRVIQTLFGEGKKGFTKFKQVVKSFLTTVKKVLFLSLKKCEKLPSKLAAFWKKIQKWIVNLVKRIIWALRVAYAWSKIILRYSLAHLWD